MENIEKCLLCNSTSFFEIYKEKKPNHKYAICRKCGHAQQINKYSFEYYDNLPYESQWGDYKNHSKNRAKYIYEFCSSYVLNPKSILDIGSGPGGVLNELKNIIGNHKCKFSGITSIQDKDKVIKGLNIEFGDFNKIEVKTKYNFIILCHVLEHSLDPKSMLRKIYNTLETNGYLYIEVPSFHWVEIRSNPMFCGVHISYFSKTQLIKLLESEGFKILKSKDSKYWGNIKILVKKVNNKVPNKLKYYENYFLKILSWKIKKYFIYSIIKFYKKIINIKPND